MSTTTTAPTASRPYRPNGKSYVGVYVDDSVLHQIDARVAELRDQGLVQINRSDVLRLLLTVALRTPRKVR